jgi:hypothetical protein
MKLRDLLGEGRTDAITGTTLSSSVTYQAARPSMIPRSPGMAMIPVLHVHASCWIGGARSSSPELTLL